MSKELKEINLELEAIESVPTGQGESFLSKILNFNSPSRHDSGKSIKHISKRLSKTPMKLAKESLFKKSPVQVGRSSPKNEKNLWGRKYEDKIKKIKILYLAKRENEEKKMEKFKKAKQIKEDLKQLDTEINEINNQLTDFKSKENNTIQKLMRHYEGLLYRGRDTRNDGLIWIIKSMWKLGKNVPMQFIPTFLDFNAIEFLFKLANKSIELENKKKLLNESKKNLILKVHKSYFYNNNTDNTNLTKNLFKGKNRRSSLLFKTNLIKQNKILQRSVSQTNIVKTYIHSSVDDEQRDQEMTTFKEISKLVEGKKINMEIGKIPGMENIEELQNISQSNSKILNRSFKKINEIPMTTAMSNFMEDLSEKQKILQKEIENQRNTISEAEKKIYFLSAKMFPLIESRYNKIKNDNKKTIVNMKNNMDNLKKKYIHKSVSEIGMNLNKKLLLVLFLNI